MLDEQREEKGRVHAVPGREGDSSSGGEKTPESGKNPTRPPALSLPKGGGAIRGIGEKFQVNAANGTASFSVPLPLSPGRSGFGPGVSLSYDSGSGNGPFGLGWNLSLPSISRKTEKGLPRYDDSNDSDIFLLSDAEDLVPVCDWDGARWSQNPRPGSWNGKDYQVQRYRPRVEGGFSRVEKWTDAASGDAFWKVVGRDNVTSLYGKDPFGVDSNARICDPSDATRVFRWLLAETYDDKGNWTVYQYVPEDSRGVDPSMAHEANRADAGRAVQRYLKNVFYGNRISRLSRTDPLQAQWMFQAVFDYGEGHYSEAPPDSDGNVFARASAPVPAGGSWPARPDPFSTFRPGFEVRTYRLCRRVLMFHLFDELGVNPCLVKSAEFGYRPDAALTTLTSVTQSGFAWRAASGNYLKKSMPSLQFGFSEPQVDPGLHFVEPDSLENLPEGLDGNLYEWADLDSEGASGILSRRPGGWYYKRNLSPLPVTAPDGSVRADARFAPAELVLAEPVLGGAERPRIMDLAGDGRKSLVQFHKPVPGFLERTGGGDWEPFRAFSSNPNLDWNDPNLRFVDLNGDGFADILVSEDEVFRWYPSRAKDGFDEARTLSKPLDEERGPALVFEDRTQTIFLADMSGDGLTDLVRIRCGEVCYWPNLGYGRFGAKVAMDDAPAFASHEAFDPGRVRLADIDGSGTTDLLYLGDDRTTFWFNRSGNSFGPPQTIPSFPDADSLSKVEALDLLGNGTACLVWSSSLPGHAGRPMRYIDLMGGKKPHLLASVDNQMGKRTEITYSPSTKFYLRDKYAGTPWATRLPFPVQVVERTDVFDLIGRNRFVARYAYHHGYYDGVEREFRGFGMVEQWDTEEFAALTDGGTLPDGDNFDAASNVPPVHTKTWFHTGAFFGRQRIDPYLRGEYYKGDAGAWAPPATQLPSGTTLADGTLPAALSGTTAHEDREACRALKGRVLRQETYADDGSALAPNPYSVVDHAYDVRMLQPVLGGNRPGLEPPHGVFYPYERESLGYHYERNPADPRIGHTLALAVDGYGNVTNAASIGYGRRPGQADPALSGPDQAAQSQVWMTYTEHRFTNGLDGASVYRTPQPCETLEYELTGFQPASGSFPFVPADFAADNFAPVSSAETIPFEQAADPTKAQKRLIAGTRSLYRSDDLSSALPLGTLQPLALPFENYKMAFTYGLALRAFANPANPAQVAEALAAPLTAAGGYVADANTLDGSVPAPHAYTAADGGLWVPSGRVFLSSGATDTAAQELAYARQHFFLPLRFQDPFGNVTADVYDVHDLLLQQTRDALGNLTTAGTRDASGNPASSGLDYRVLQPSMVTDPNQNRSAVAFDCLGLVVGTAVMGKPAPAPAQGDSLTGFPADLTDAVIAAHLADPLANPGEILQQATSRLVYDLFAFQRSRTQAEPRPNVVYTLTRETHSSDLGPGQTPRFQHGFSYSDGLGRAIQSKIQAEPGPLDLADPSSPRVDPRWVGSGWTIFNNKGKPVRKYEPFFSSTHLFDYATAVGVSPVLFYDPLGRVAATLHPNHTYEKVLFTPWDEAHWDVNDTVLLAPSADPDVSAYFSRIPATDYSPTWYARRQPGGSMSLQEQAAAAKAAAHAGTPGFSYLDSLGRPFLTVADNGQDSHGTPQKYRTRTRLDVQGNLVSVTDALERVVMTYAFGMLKNRVRQSSMEAGSQWKLDDASGKPFYSWSTNAQNRRFRQAYDALHRPTQHWLSLDGGAEVLLQWMVYGEGLAGADTWNLLGRLHQAHDQGGLLTNAAYDFKGNLLAGSRRFAANYKPLNGAPYQVDWSAVLAGTVPADSLLEKRNPADPAPETFTASSTYDALNRPVTLTAPDATVTLPRFNQANLLESLDVRLQGGASRSFLTSINYNAKGQRTDCQYAGGVQTRYIYDPQTFRLARIQTTRPTPGSTTGAVDALQDLNYVYDAVGNITEIDDGAQETVYFRNAAVVPGAQYTYDPLYRLIQARGREHLGQAGGGRAPLPLTSADGPRVRLPQPGDGGAMGAYQQQYQYDAAGNILQTTHQGVQPTNPGWARVYAYDEPSLLEPGKVSNRLSRSIVNPSGNPPVTEPYSYDPHGNITGMAHLPVMAWDCLDQLSATASQAVAGGTPETTYYVYGADGQRLRKVTESQAAAGRTPSRVNQRLYLQGFESYREYAGDGVAIDLEREALHVMDDKRRIALVETRTQGSDPAPQQLVRFQFDNHLGSACLELDDQAQIISYEEYYPYGGTSYQSVRSQSDRPKRYRYTGKERDEENAFYYNAARYYVPWLGRWTSCDPVGDQDSENLYQYARQNPILFSDPTGHGSKSTTLGQRGEEIQKKLAHAVNRRRRQLNKKEVEWEYQKRHSGGKKITDQYSGSRDIANDMKARNLSKWVDKDGELDVALVKADLRKQFESSAQRIVYSGVKKEKQVFTLFGKDSMQHLSEYRKLAKATLKEWQEEATDAATRALREKVGVTVTTAERYLKATKKIEGKVVETAAAQRAEKIALKDAQNAVKGTEKVAAEAGEKFLAKGTKNMLGHAAERQATHETENVGEHVLASGAGEEGGRLLGDAVPFLGIAIGYHFYQEDKKRGDTEAQFWDAAGMIPGVGDVVLVGQILFSSNPAY